MKDEFCTDTFLQVETLCELYDHRNANESLLKYNGWPITCEFIMSGQDDVLNIFLDFPIQSSRVDSVLVSPRICDISVFRATLVSTFGYVWQWCGWASHIGQTQAFLHFFLVLPFVALFHLGNSMVGIAAR